MELYKINKIYLRLSDVWFGNAIRLNICRILERTRLP